MSAVYELWKLVQGDDVVQVQQLFKKTPRVKSCVNEYVGFLTCLHLACIEGSLEICKFLLEQNADPLLKAKVNDWTSLHFAAKKGNVECLRLLLQSQPALISERNNKGQTALYAAVCNDRHSAVKLLLRHKSRVNVRDHTGRSPLHYAVQFGHIECITSLVASGADLQRRVSFTDTTAVCWLAKHDHRSKLGKTAFELAVANKQHTAAALLKQLESSGTKTCQTVVGDCSESVPVRSESTSTVAGFVTKL